MGGRGSPGRKRYVRLGVSSRFALRHCRDAFKPPRRRGRQGPTIAGAGLGGGRRGFARISNSPTQGPFLVPRARDRRSRAPGQSGQGREEKYLADARALRRRGSLGSSMPPGKSGTLNDSTGSIPTAVVVREGQGDTLDPTT